MGKNKWSIVIPCFNERLRIGNFYRKVEEFLQRQGVDYEIILVNDGSWDGTLELLEQLGADSDNHTGVINIRHNRGKGYAIREGFLAACGDYVCTIDADGATPIAELGKVMGRFNQDGQLDIVIGSRELRSDNTVVKDDWKRRVMGRIFNLIVRKVTGLRFRDTQCGFKNYRYSSCAGVFKDLRTFGWAHDVEVLLRASKMSLRIEEVPVNWQAVGKSKISPLRDSLRMLREVLKISRELKHEKFPQ